MSDFGDVDKIIKRAFIIHCMLMLYIQFGI